MEEDHQINSNINVHNINPANQIKNRRQIYEQLSKSCEEIVRNININNAYFNAFLLLVILIQAASISYLYVICFLWLFDIQELYKQVVFLRNIKKNVQNYLPAHQLLKRSIKLEILDCLVGFFFKLCIVLYEENQIYTMVAPSIIAFCYFGIHIILRILCHRAKPRLGQQDQEDETGVLESIQVLEAQQQTNSFYFIINNWVFRIYIVTQALFFSLKSEGWINWSWGEVFWVFWVFFCVIIGVTLIIFLLMVVKVCDYCAGSPKEIIEIVGLIWFFLIMGLISANSCYTVLQYCTVLTDIDDTRDTYNKTDVEIAGEQTILEASREYLYHIVFQISIGFAVQFGYYAFFRRKIGQFVKLIMFEFDEEELERIGKDEEQHGGQQNQQEIQQQQQDEDQNGQHRENIRGNKERDGQDNEKEEEPQQKPKKVRMAYKSKFILEEQKVIPAVNLPQFVSKVSSTYFKLLTGGKDLEQEVDQRKEQLEKKKKEKKKISAGKQRTKDEDKQNNLQQLQRLKNKRNPAGSSIKSLNRSATAAGTLSTQGAMTLNTQGTMNTQADMLGSFRGVCSGDQNELEDVFSDESNKQGEKKDARAENFNKKNFKALNRQKLGPREEGAVANSSNYEDANSNNQSKKTTKNLVITLAGKGKDEVGMLKLDDVVTSEKQIGAVISPVCGNGESPMFASPNNFGNTQGNSSSRRHISLATTFKRPSGDKNIAAINRTAPFQAQSNPYDEDLDQHGIKEEDEEHGSYLDDGYQTSHKTKQQHRDTQGVPQHETIALSEDSYNHSQQQESILSSSQQPSVANCLVCFDSQPDALFNPCGHGGLCYECAIDLLKKTAECLLCRTKIDEVLKIDIESKSLGIMKILTSTKFIKIREKIEITEQEYQYYSALQRNRRNMAGGGADGSAPQPLPPLPQHSSPLQFHRLQDQHVQRQEGQEEEGRVQAQLLESQQAQQLSSLEGQQQQQQQQPPAQDFAQDRHLREDQVLHDDDGARQDEQIVQDQGQIQEQINSGRQHSQELGDNLLLNK